MKKLNISKEFLIKEYITNHKPVNKIAQEFGYGETTIFRYLNNYNIKIRKVLEYTKVRLSNPKNNPFFIDGRTLKKYFCKGGCGKEVSVNTYLYHGGCCRDCGALSGEDSPHFVDGHSTKEYYCKECGAKISCTSGHYGGGLCNSCSQKGERSNKYIDGRSSKTYYCIELDCHNEICYDNWREGKQRCPSCAGKELWKNEEFREKNIKASLKGLQLKPNKPETILGKLLGKDYKFVGDGKVILGGFCPDFININGQKKIVEMYGDYWHNLPKRIETDKRRIPTYKKYGYRTLIVWEHELKNLTKLKSKLINFNYAKNKK